MTLDGTALPALTVAAFVLAALALAVAVRNARRLRHLRRSAGTRRAPAPEGAIDGDLARELAEVRDVLATAIQRVGLVRFDAFEDMGGKLSFAVAMLDADANGVVFSSINGRSETRIYAKPIEAGTSRVPLSEEETEAIRRALGGVTV